MATELERVLFEEEFQEVQRLPDATRWTLERDDEVPLGLYATMHSSLARADLYKARLRWDDYFGPFSLKFVDPESNDDTKPTAWPQCWGFRPPSLDACLPFTLEGHRLHPEWASSPLHRFPTIEAPMHFALLQLQHLLDTTYAGRGH